VEKAGVEEGQFGLGVYTKYEQFLMLEQEEYQQVKSYRYE
jgi:hypothetical protein